MYTDLRFPIDTIVIAPPLGLYAAFATSSAVFRTKNTFIPCWMINIDTNDIKFMNTAEDVAKAANKPSGGAITMVSMGKRKSVYKWRLATQDEINDQSRTSKLHGQ